MSSLTRNLLFTVFAVALLAASWLWFSRRAPALARSLPEADAIVYADLRPLHVALRERHLPPFTPSPEYQHFIEQTGILPERDLDQAAFALTRRPDPAGANGPVAFTEILEGRFDAERLKNYLDSLAPARESYAGHTIFLLPTGSGQAGLPTRELRVTLLRQNQIAISNAPTPEQLHSLLDRDRTPFAAPPSVLSHLFPEVPRFAPLWAVGQLGLLSPADPTAPAGPIAVAGLTLPIPADEPLILSIRYLGDLRLRVEALTPSRDLALQQAGALAGMLSLFRVLAPADSSKTAGPAFTAVLASLSVAQSDQHPDRVVLTATVPVALLFSPGAH